MVIQRHAIYLQKIRKAIKTKMVKIAFAPYIPMDKSRGITAHLVTIRAS
jgi:hypothetical protein